MDERRAAISLTAEETETNVRATWKRKREGGNGFLQFFCPSEEENKGPYTREGARIRSVQVARASTMGLNFNKVKCRYAARLSLNEIALQAERVSSCCFCTALIMQPRSPRPCPYAHKVNTRRLPQPGDVATSVHPWNKPFQSQPIYNGVAVGTEARGRATFWGFRSLVLGLGGIY